MRIHIKQGDKKLYNHAFFPDQCVECTITIEEGDPIGWLTESDGRYGPLCFDCTQTLATPTEIKVT